MPPPTGSRRPSPEELARRIAARLAEKDEPSEERFSWRNSVLVGQLISGAIVLSTAAILVLGIYAGVDLLVDPSPPVLPQVLSAEISTEDDPGTTTGVPTTANFRDFIGVFGTPGTTAAASGTTTAPNVEGIGVPLPPPSTTSTSTPAVQSSTSTTNPSRVTTTQPSATSTSSGPMTTTSTSTSTLPRPSIPTTTTTATPPTTVPTTTTIETSTTTVIEETTTSCGNNGSGKGNC